MPVLKTDAPALTLHKCWFCGYAKVKIHAKKTTDGFGPNLQEHYTANVRCNRCHARGPTTHFMRPFTRDVPPAIPDDVKAEAARLWNAVKPDDTKGN